MRTATILLSLALTACGGGDDDGGGGGGGGDPVVVLMDTVGPEGGDLDGDGVRLRVPADAIAEAVEVTITAQEQNVSGYTRYSPVFSVAPADLELAAPIEVLIEASEADGTFYWTAAGSAAFDVVDSEYADDSWVSATVDHLGSGFVGKPGETGAMCGDGPACTGGDICVEGVCMPYESP